MLQTLRKRASGVIGIGIIAVLVLAFALWGVNDFLQTFNDETVATVSGEEIRWSDFYPRFQAEVDFFSQQTKNPLSLSDAVALNLDVLVLQQLTSTMLLNNFSHAIGLRTSEASVVRNIRNNPAFQNAAGAFDLINFRRILAENSTNEGAYVQTQKNFMRRLQLLETLSQTVTVPDVLIRAANIHFKEKRTVRYVAITPKVLGKKPPKPTAASLEEFYQQSRALFQKEETRRVAFIKLSQEALAGNVRPTDQQLQQIYQQQRLSYAQPERRSFEQAVFSTNAEAASAHESLKKGQSFQKVAKNYTKLDLLTRAQIISPKIAEAVFALKMGELSAPIQGSFGTVLVRPVKVVPASQLSFKEVKDTLRKDFKAEKASEQIDALYNTIEDALAAGDTLNDIARNSDLPLTRTGFIAKKLTQNGTMDTTTALKERNSTAFIDHAFTVDVEEAVQPINLEDGSYVWIQVEEIKPASIPPLAVIRPEVISAWQKQWARDQLTEKAKDMVKKARGGADFEKLAYTLQRALLKNTLTRQNSGNVFSPSAVEKIFSMNKKDYAFTPALVGESVIVMQLTSVTLPTSLDEKEKTQLAGSMREVLANLFTTQLLTQLRATHNVTINANAARARLTNTPASLP